MFCSSCGSMSESDIGGNCLLQVYNVVPNVKLVITKITVNPADDVRNLVDKNKYPVTITTSPYHPTNFSFSYTDKRILSDGTVVEAYPEPRDFRIDCYCEDDIGTKHQVVYGRYNNGVINSGGYNTIHRGGDSLIVKISLRKTDTDEYVLCIDDDM